jgi:dTDP-4-amino-4,6-dideoxygalactose transaminase
MRFIPRKIPTALTGRLSALFAELRGGDDAAVARFEAAVATLVGRRHAVAAGGARACFVLWARAMGLPLGGKALVPSYTAPIVPAMMRAAGLVPVPVPVDPATFNLDVGRLPLDERDVALVVACHTEGVPCEVDRVVEIARARGWAVIEDGAHALCSRLRGRRVGTFGDAAYLSFGKGKQVNLLKGGVLLLDDDAVAERVRRLRDGLPRAGLAGVLPGLALDASMALLTRPGVRELTLRPAVTLPWLLAGKDLLTDLFEEKAGPGGLQAGAVTLHGMPAVSARMGVGALRRAEAEGARRRALAAVYREELEGRVRLQEWPAGAEVAPLELSVLVPPRRGPGQAERAGVQKELLRLGIDTQRTWLVDWWAAEGNPSADPLASELERGVLYLPTYPALREVEARRVAKALLTVLARGRGAADEMHSNQGAAGR